MNEGEKEENTMSKVKRIFWLSLSMALIFILNGWIEHGCAQPKYPTRAIDLVVTFPAGGGTDLVGRVAATFLNKTWGVPVNIINKPGGKTIPGSFEVFNAAPNGYTLLVTESGCSEFLVVAEKNLPFDIMERTYMGTYAAQAYLLLSSANSPFKTLKDLIAECKNNPQNITYASVAGTTAIDYALRQFFDAIGADISKAKPVLCSGGADVATLLAGGHVVLGSASTASSLSSIRGGTVKPLFIAYKERNPLLPDVPTSAEVGLPTVISTNWYGISGPPKLPAHIIKTWEAALKEMVKDPQLKTQLEKVGAVPLSLTAQENKDLIVKNLADIKKYWR
jgi:tripartite-type tricarboxylate transporter receptor subunit TctC